MPLYYKPSIKLLNECENNYLDSLEDVKICGAAIQKVLHHNKIYYEKLNATIGANVTLYEIYPNVNTRVSKVKNIINEIALATSAHSVRFIPYMQGKGTIGIEIPNKTRKIVPLIKAICSYYFVNDEMELPIGLGVNVDHKPFVVDLAKMPHLLIAGATGQGKSVCINAILCSLLFKKAPDELKLILIDPKKVELSPYAKISNNFLSCTQKNKDNPIIIDTKDVVDTLNSVCELMDIRYDLLKMAGVRNVQEYQKKWRAEELDREESTPKGYKHTSMPYIVIVIDEFADLIMTAGRDVEYPLTRLAQLARAIGIHLIIATQRPTVDVITGLIKANFPARIAFRVASKMDSKVILDQNGAEQLIGNGDMLFLKDADITRLQCAYVSTDEVFAISNHIGEQKIYGVPYII